MKYLFLFLILISCSLEKDSAYWKTEELRIKSTNDKRLTRILNKTYNSESSSLAFSNDYKTMSFEEFDLFLKDYSNKAEYPNINK